MLQLLADLDGPLTQSELRWLYRQVRALPDHANVLEVNPGAGQVTCCLALGCWGSRRHVYTLWTDAAGDWSTEEGRTLVIWHQNVIRKHLVPYITPILLGAREAVPSYPDHVALLYLGQDPLYPGTEVRIQESVLTSLLPNALVLQRGDSLSPHQQLALAGNSPMGSLSYGYWSDRSRESGKIG